MFCDLFILFIQVVKPKLVEFKKFPLISSLILMKKRNQNLKFLRPFNLQRMIFLFLRTYTHNISATPASVTDRFGRMGLNQQSPAESPKPQAGRRAEPVQPVKEAPKPPPGSRNNPVAQSAYKHSLFDDEDDSKQQKGMCLPLASSPYPQFLLE
jgi:hypothetical protein